MTNTIFQQGLLITNEQLVNSNRQIQTKMNPQTCARMKQYVSCMCKWGDEIN